MLILEKTSFTPLQDVPLLISTNTNATEPNARSPQHIISSSISTYINERSAAETMQCRKIVHS